MINIDENGLDDKVDDVVNIACDNENNLFDEKIDVAASENINS